MTPLETSLLLSYLHSKSAITNLEVSVHEMKVLNRSDSGKLQHSFEKLISAHRKAFAVMERNIENKALLESDFEEQINENWRKLI